MEPKVGAGVVGVAAQHAQPVDPHGAGVVDPHRPPQPARVPVAVDRLGVLEDPGDVAPAARALLRGARDLDGEHVLIRPSRRGP